MINTATINKLIEMRMSAMANALRTQMQDNSIVNGRDKLSQKWSFKSEPLWNGRGIISMLSDLIPDKEENGLKKRRPYWTYSY